jgi:hypothetical protein
MALAEIVEETRSFSATKQRILNGAFDLVKRGGTDSGRVTAVKSIFKIKSQRKVLKGQFSLTSATESLSVRSMSGIEMMEDDQPAEVPAIVVAGPAWRAAAADLAYARTLFDGWKGPGSLKPSKDAIEDATSILSAMATAFATSSRPVAPALGVDAGGEIVMSWGGREGLFGSMSISGDGTFAFYVECGNRSAEDGDLPIAGSLPKPFIEVLLGGEAGHD